MPSPAAEPVAPAPAAASEPAALAEAPVAEPPPSASPEPPAQPLPSALPDPIVPPAPSMEQPPPNAARKLRVSRVERRALAAAAPEEPPAAVPEPALAPVAQAEGEAPTAPGLPAQPSRDQVSAALNAVVPALQKCVGDRHDTADVTLTVRPGGFVSYAVVSGAYAGSTEGSCIARAVKAAKFPAFSDPSVRITYPFQL
jgi:hypothetical protein